MRFLAFKNKKKHSDSDKPSGCFSDILSFTTQMHTLVSALVKSSFILINIYFYIENDSFYQEYYFTEGRLWKMTIENKSSIILGNIVMIYRNLFSIQCINNPIVSYH